MAKFKTEYICSECGNKSTRWEGKCHVCGTWDSYIEEVISKDRKGGKLDDLTQRWKSKPLLLKTIRPISHDRIHTADQELDQVLGGGLVPGSVVLIGGQPGIGKSTLSLQICLRTPKKTLYVSGEESESQIKMRAERIGKIPEQAFIYTRTVIEHIIQEAISLNPDFVVIDSIQTVRSNDLDSAPGTVTQVRHCTSQLIDFAKTANIPILIIGHINKEGSIAGPKVLEHMVDTVLQFEGDRNYHFRVLRTIKNRFGSTDEIGIYEMRPQGLKIVLNPSDILLSQIEETLSGISVAATLEGNRAVLIETQALVSTSAYGTPQRSSTGFDSRRLGMLLAVLEKRVGFNFAQQDVFLNLAGGMKIIDPAIDLSIVSALVSSLLDIPVPKEICFAGEVGLSGEIRTVKNIEKRFQEAAKIGFKKIYISKYHKAEMDWGKYNIEIIKIAKLEDLYRDLFS